MLRLRQILVQLVVVSLSTSGVGCAHLSKWMPAGRSKKPAAQPAAVPHRVGSVTMVNEELRFVLIDTGSLYRPGVGRALKTFRGGQETGVLTVSPEYRRPYLAADVVSGAPEVGDDVFE